jgi:hypothetical protein
MRTVKTIVCTAVMFVAVGVWAVASIKADARYTVPAALALEQVDVIQLTLNATELPVQQFDAF